MEGANLTKKIKEANKPMKYGELEKQAFMEATTCHICEKDLGEEINGRVDHLENMKEWLEILQLDLRKIPNEKELKNLVPRIQNSRFLLTSDNITTPLYALFGIIRFVRLGHNIKNPKFDQNPLRIE